MSDVNKYAIIKNGVIKNIILCDAEFAASIAGQVVSLENASPEPHIGWTYDGVNFSEPSVSLPMVKAQKISEFREALFTFRDSKYDSNMRESLQMIYLLARLDGLTNRIAYMQPLIDWRLDVISYGVSFVQSVNAMDTAADVLAATWNFEESLPINLANVTLFGALSIED